MAVTKESTARCPKCGINPNGEVTCCAGAWKGKCGDDGKEHTWTEGLLACRCKRLRARVFYTTLLICIFTISIDIAVTKAATVAVTTSTSVSTVTMPARVSAVTTSTSVSAVTTSTSVSAVTTSTRVSAVTTPARVSVVATTTSTSVSSSKCPKCGINPNGDMTCCAGTWKGKCGDEVGEKEYTWTEGLLACKRKHV